jgi:hypothetical protein
MKAALIFTIVIGIAVALSFVGLVAYAIIDNVKYTEWYESLTPAERESYDMQKQQEYENRIRRYEVVGVHKYLKTTTNNFGGVIRTDVCYTFTYLAGGVLYSVEGFDHNRIIIGDTDMYIINHNNGTQTLQLTKETITNMKGLD